MNAQDYYRRFQAITEQETIRAEVDRVFHFRDLAGLLWDRAEQSLWWRGSHTKTEDIDFRYQQWKRWSSRAIAAYRASIRRYDEMELL